MACTPNDRHVKNNFLFATSTFIDTMSSTVDVQLEERRLSEYNKRNKALKLLNMLKVNTEPHTPVKAVDTSVDDYNTSSQLYIGNTPTTTEERINVEEPAVQVVATVTPLRMTQSSVPSTPSPFRASPARGPQQEEEQFVRLLARDSRRALNLLQQRYLPKPAGTIPRPGSAQRVSTPLSGAGRGAVLWDRLRSAVVREEEDRTPPLTPHEESEEQEVLFTNTDLPLPPMGQAMPRDYWRTENYFCPAEAKSLDMERYFSVGDGILYVERHGALEEPSSPAVRKNVVLPYYPSSPLVDHFSASGQAPLASTSSRTSMMWRTGDREQDEHYVLTPNDFMMPDSSEAMAVVRRIQRDVTGMNEVAKEQTKRRGEEALQARVEALLSHPTEEENQLMEDWHTSYYITAKDPLQSALIPKALLPYAGPDYVTQDLRALAQQHTWRPPARSGVEEWQEEQETRRGPDAARRVLATYGSSQLGLPILPLATPLTGLSSEDHHGWVTEREELFRNYAMQKKDDVVALPPLM
ncbi:hypothetical protein AGDE_14893 [Angomonas deanei]|uniref:Uncharacterized protein n=1 Tax=Angomonas deanei TaxID=59799 RepID=A0A7G2CJQ3_9TRYP|nr:hypothetical protein AGDE_14893 [Angomonas deanei]CAD2218492.1 hypothetical protein, conserved [Angomonas deanei]|eukprot:EPY20057.1 hypothetical protein AGDE_14893 [Angomonas deanei]